MRTIIFLFFNICFIINIFSQKSSSELDSIINIYERKYRTELNKSDTILINELILKTKNGNENIFDTLITSKNFSETFKKVFAIKFIEKKLDFEHFLKTLKINNKFSETNIYSSENNPFYDAIISNKLYIDIISKFILESKYVENCDFLFGLNKIETKRLSFIIKQSQLNFKIIDLKIVSCKVSNLFILSNL